MNDSPRKQSAKDIFLDALEIDVSDRSEFLTRITGDQTNLREQVEALLHAHADMSADSTGSHTSLAGVSGLPSSVELFEEFPHELEAGQTVGPFTLEREIGRGGFGRVWLASQTEPVRRKVALKLIKAGLDTHEVTTRFLAERQALALMDHPNIARIFDGGATKAGLPWFAMEYVDGVPITRYCTSHHSNLHDRLALFLGTCRAVQHAHQKSIIHRDLKPNNVLVAEVDGKPAPKVIDFGIAKAIEQSLTAEPLATRGGQGMGTPAFMSPEQITEAADVDTRADIYSLGTLLYQMLTGFQPFADKKGQLPPTDDLLRAVQHADPMLPSIRVKSAGNSFVIRERDLRGDLDWIVMRCLEKDRERRYDSVALLANDIERHLAGDTVLAGPPTLIYRLSKLTKRYKAALLVVFALFAMLAAGIIAATLQANRAIRAEELAQEETRKAKLESERFESIASLLERVLMGIEPEVAKGMDLELMSEILAQAHRHVDKEQPSPEVEATIRRVIGGAYLSIARYEESEIQLKQTLALREGALGPDHNQTLQSAEELGALYLTWGKLQLGIPLVERCYQGRVSQLGLEHEDTMQALNSLAAAHTKTAKYDVAAKELRILRAWYAKNFGPTDRRTLLATNNLATALNHIGESDEAVALFEKLVEWQTEIHGPDGAVTLMALGNLGSLYSQLGRHPEALKILERSLESKRRILSEGHPSLLVAFSNLARVHQQLEDYEAAERLFDEALTQGMSALGPDQRHVQIIQLNRANLFLSTDRKAKALEILENLLPKVEANEAEDSPFLKAVRARLKIAQE